MASPEDWRLCVEWLIRCEMISEDHKLAMEEAQVFDLAQLIRDGVLLCHLLNRLRPGSIDSKDFSQRPQMSQFLCLKNIRVFLLICRNTFGIADNDLFDPFDLFDVKDFGKVINTLSILSSTPEAQKSQIQGFRTRSRTDYHPLQSLASSRTPEDDIYDVKYHDEDHEIYEDLCSLRRRTSVQESTPVTKRDYCIKELVETEKNYVDALHMIIDCFIKRLRSRISEEDCQMLFMGVENLHTIHAGFYSDLSKACSSRHNSFGSVGQLTIADCFIKWKEKFLAYGEFCSNLPKVQGILDRLMQNQAIQQCIVECQKDANGGKFRLRDLLSVPMQRVLKYHLLLKELIKNTDQLHPDRKSLERALDEMQDLSGYVNEVKRDNENLQWIEEVERSIIDLTMPDGTHLRDYGRLLKDGELRVRRHTEKKDRALMVFLFDKVMLICKSRMVDKFLWGENYNYKDALALSHYTLEEPVAGLPKEKDRFPFVMLDKKTKEPCTFITKTQELRTKWVEAIKLANENACPPFYKHGRHEFVMQTFTTPTICDVCRKLLRGVFFQGYLCNKTSMVVHKGCIEKAKDVAGPPRVPPKKDRQPSTPAVPTNRHCRGKVKAISTYQGLPAPPNNLPYITFEENEIFTFVSEHDESWWLGRIGGKEGYFPKSFVILQKSFKNPSPFDSLTNISMWSTSSPSLSIDDSPLNGRHGSLSSISSVASSPSYFPSLNDFNWFAGELNREEAAKILDKLPAGTFLVRVSNVGTRKGEYALSIRFGVTNPVKHIKLQKSSEGMFYLVDCKMFRGIPELVQYYQLNSLERSFPEITSTLGTPYKEVLNPPPADPPGLGICFAQYDFSPMEPNQIAFKTGDRIVIISKSAAIRGFWQGRLNDKVGYFPIEYVTEGDETV